MNKDAIKQALRSMVEGLDPYFEVLDSDALPMMRVTIRPKGEPPFVLVCGVEPVPVVEREFERDDG